MVRLKQEYLSGFSKSSGKDGKTGGYNGESSGAGYSRFAQEEEYQIDLPQPTNQPFETVIPRLDECKFLLLSRRLPLHLTSPTDFYLPPGEHLFILPDGGAIHFIAGDRPQEFFGSEACIVRNHRFDGLYFLRTNLIMKMEVLQLIAGNFVRNGTVEARNYVYLSNQAHVGERIVGISCGLYVGDTMGPLPIYFSPLGLDLHNRSMLMCHSPWAMSSMREIGVEHRRFPGPQAFNRATSDPTSLRYRTSVQTTPISFASLG